MKYFSFLISLFLLSLLIISCGTEHGKLVIANIAGEDVTLSDFENAYKKNSGETTANNPDTNSILKFWNLYKNFKLKLADAKEKGYDTNPELLNELEQYKRKVGVSYLLEKQLLEPGMRDIYDKRKVEYRVSHIMIRIDTLSKEEAKARAEEVIKKYKAGEKFEDLALQYSDDTYSKKNGGDLYYITWGQTLPEFDDAVYKTEVNNIYPEPVETRFGYHVIKVTDKKDRRYQVRVKHILLDFVDSVGNVDSALAKRQIEDIRNQIVANKITFEDAAMKYSEDRGSASKGGDLGFFERRSMILPFDEASFSMKPNELSPVIETKFGYHLIKFVEEKPYPSFEEEKNNLKTMYKRSLYDAKYNELISELKTKYKYSKNDEGIKFVLSKLDSNKFNNDYYNSDFRKAVSVTTLFTVNDVAVSLDSVIGFVINDPKFQNKLIDEKNLNEAIDETSKNALLELKALTLESTDPNFAQLMKDYKQGIYIFKIQEEEIWNNIKLDSAKLVEFYNNTKENYKWKDGVDFNEIFSKKDSLINVYYDKLVQGASFDSLAKLYTERPGFKLKSGAYGMVDIDNNEIAQKAFAFNVGDITKPVQVNGGYSIFKINKKRNAGLKTFEEAKAEVASLFQESESRRLEKEYVDRLNAKYPVKNFKEDVLLKAFKSEK
jgi:peptidyl-prolyl cis-trans isomerase SurA